MTIEASLESIANSLAIMAAPANVRSEPEPHTNAADAEAAEAKKKEAAKKRKEAAAAKKKADDATNESPSEVPDPCTKEDLRDKLTTLTEELGREVVLALFQRLGVANLKGLSEDKYADAWTLGDRALKEGAEVITGS